MIGCVLAIQLETRAGQSARDPANRTACRKQRDITLSDPGGVTSSNSIALIHPGKL